MHLAHTHTHVTHNTRATIPKVAENSGIPLALAPTLTIKCIHNTRKMSYLRTHTQIHSYAYTKPMAMMVLLLRPPLLLLLQRTNCFARLFSDFCCRLFVCFFIEKRLSFWNWAFCSICSKAKGSDLSFILHLLVEMNERAKGKKGWKDWPILIEKGQALHIYSIKLQFMYVTNWIGRLVGGLCPVLSNHITPIQHSSRQRFIFWRSRFEIWG